MSKRRSRSLPKGCFWRGDVIWFRATVQGRQHRESLRTSDVADAERKAARIRARLIAKAFGGEYQHSYEEAFAAWAEHMAGQIAPTTAKRYAVSFGQMEPILRPLMIDDIDDEVVAQIVKVRRRAGAATATIRRDLTALSSLLDFATEEKWRHGNPALDRMRRMSERITHAEIVELFGEAMPIEAAALLFTPPDGATVASLREQLAAMAVKWRSERTRAHLVETVARALVAGLDAQKDMDDGFGPCLYGDESDGLESFGIDGRVNLLDLADHVIGALQASPATGQEA